MLSRQQLPLALLIVGLWSLVWLQPAISDDAQANANRSASNYNHDQMIAKRSTSPDEHHQPLDDSNNSPHYEPLVHEADEGAINSDSGQPNAAAAGRPKGKRTLYACEKEQLQIECQLGESIQLIRANYGRFSIQICNEHGMVDWKVNCMSPDSYQRIANSCQAKQSCRLLASNSIFGDACPGTSKYLEVHYQCLPMGSAQNATSKQGTNQPASQQRPQQMTSSKGPTVIQELPSPTATTTTSTSPSTLAPSDSTPIDFRPPPPFRWSQPEPNIPPQLPPWMAEIRGSLNGSLAQPGHFCPETVWRQIRWPQTGAGRLMQMPCPAHAQPVNPMDVFAASLLCGPDGRWAERVQAAKCQSLWLKNLTFRFEQGDSPLYILSELVHRTRPAQQTIQQSSTLLSILPHGLYSSENQAQQQLPGTGLFGDDIVQLSRIVKRLTDGMSSYLHGINEDKSRLAMAKEMVQSLVELINNLSHEQHSDAWLDLQEAGGELRQRLGSQLMLNLESALVLMASASGDDFLKTSDHVYVSIRPYLVQQANKTIDVAFPSEASVLGTKWQADEQRFTLHLQTSLQADQSAAPAQAAKHLSLDGASPEQLTAATLKIVFVMIKGLGNQMEQASGQDTGSRLIVNSNLVSFSFVADTRAIKVEMPEPVELLFKHNFQEQQKNLLAEDMRWPQAQRPKSPSCVYWDNALSHWSPSGCVLLVSNATHSLCSCSQLTTFAILSELDALDNNTLPSQADQPRYRQQQQPPSSSSSSAGQQHSPAEQRVQLDCVENEFTLPPPSNQKLLYLAKLLDGHLFDSTASIVQTAADQQQTTINVRLLLYISCLLSATLLAFYLTALAYNQAHARRLLGSIPAQPPPPLLITNQNRLIGGALDNATNSTYNSTQSASNDSYSAAMATTLGLSGAKEAVDRESGHVKVPYYIYIQLFILQLLMVFLVESQNYFSKNSRSYSASLCQQQPEQLVNPIGLITWAVVLVLYYLILSLTCWLLGQLIKLNLRLVTASSASQRNRASLYGTGNGAVVARNVYGSNVYNQQLSTISPSSSSYSSAENGQQQQQQSNYTLQRGQPPAELLMKSHATGQVRAKSSTGCLSALICGNKYLNDKMIDLLFIHFLPVLATIAILYLNWNVSQAINYYFYTLSYGSQLAYWPLLVELSVPFYSMIIYTPILGLILIGLAIFLLNRRTSSSSAVNSKTLNQSKFAREMFDGAGRSHQLNSNQSISIDGTYNGPSAAKQENPQQQHQEYAGDANNKGYGDLAGYFQDRASSGFSPAGLSGDQLKTAKFACFILATLLVLHSISWIIFFNHIQRDLNTPANFYGGTSTVRLYLFAAVNLLLSLILVLMQRGPLRRACQLSGLKNFSVRHSPSKHHHHRTGHIHSLHQHHLGSSSSSSGNVDANVVLDDNRSSYYHGNRIQQTNLHQKQSSLNLNISPSNNSLFLISQQANRQFLNQTNSNYGAGLYNQSAYQQHLYQQLTSNQHIYDSATALNGAGSPEHMMQLVQRQQHQQQLNNNFNRSVGSLHHIHHQQQQQQVDSFRQPMTLKPMQFRQSPNDGQVNCHQANEANCQLLQLDAQSALKQQLACQQQVRSQHLSQPLPGEADGPLVALSSLSSQNSASSASQQSGQLLQQPATFGPNTSKLGGQHSSSAGATSEHQLFNQQHRQQESINCINEQQPAGNCITSGANFQNANQYCYTDALKTAMLQQQQQHGEQQLHHFRRQNSNKRPQSNFQVNQQQRASNQAMIDHHHRQQQQQHVRMNSGKCPVMNQDDNIYDVANYVLNQ